MDGAVDHRGAAQSGDGKGACELLGLKGDAVRGDLLRAVFRRRARKQVLLIPHFFRQLWGMCNCVF
jgi:hypothetical protein